MYLLIGKHLIEKSHTYSGRKEGFSAYVCSLDLDEPIHQGTLYFSRSSPVIALSVTVTNQRGGLPKKHAVPTP